MIAVMVGGPAHGQTRWVQHPLPWHIMVPRPVVVDFTDPVEPLATAPDPYRYELRWYRSPRAWMEREHMPAYLCMEDPTPIRLSVDADEKTIYYARLAEGLWHQAFEATIPGCVAPDCTGKGRLTFTAGESGRLAGREWRRGDEIRLCHNHGHDVYRAQGAYGMDQLADWLQADAMYDPLDAYDIATDPLYRDQIDRRRARVLRIAHRIDAP